MSDQHPELRLGPGTSAWLVRPARWEALLLVLIGLLVVALGVMAGSGEGESSARTDGSARAALSAAEQHVVAMTSLDHKRIDAQVRQLRATTTGPFRQRFDRQAKAFARAVRQSRVLSTGRVVASGVLARDGERVRALVVTQASVRSGRGGEPRRTSYRYVLELQRVGGAWLVAGMEELA